MFRRKIIEEPREPKPKNNGDKIWYRVIVKPVEDSKGIAKESYTFNVKTDDIEWTMKQYQRNRDPFKWELA